MCSVGEGESGGGGELEKGRVGRGRVGEGESGMGWGRVGEGESGLNEMRHLHHNFTHLS